jgi:hypothetical protein
VDGFIAWEICGIIAIVVAVSKGRSACLWLIFGLWFGPIAMLVSFFITRKQKEVAVGSSGRCTHLNTYDEVYHSSDGYMKFVTRCRCGHVVSRHRA